VSSGAAPKRLSSELVGRPEGEVVAESIPISFGEAEIPAARACGAPAMRACVVLSTLACCAAVDTLFDDAPGVQRLQPKTLEAISKNRQDAWIVNFYAPWCVRATGCVRVPLAAGTTGP
jgi:hypothetical protein